VKKIGNAHFVDRLHDQAEILRRGACCRPAPSLTPSNLTLDDLDGSKVSVKVFDSKYLENGDRYEVGPGEYLYVGPTGF